MMLLVLDKDSVKAAQKVPDKLKFKQLLELAQMVSTITGSVYKPIRQGKELMEWIKENRLYVMGYYDTLLSWCEKNIHLKEKTISDLNNIFFTLDDIKTPYKKIDNAIFRYLKEYTNTEYATNSELPIDIAIEEYTKYLKWKGY